LGGRQSVTNEPISGSDPVDWLVQFLHKANQVVKGGER